MKKTILGYIFLACCIFAVSMWCNGISEELRDNVVRLHIIANSDSPFDQDVKLKIRDRLLEVSKKNGHTPTLKEMEQEANDVLDSHNAQYKATAHFGRYTFDRRDYEGFILPKGDYTAVRIELGQAQGRNWWCVLSPPVCFTKSSVKLKEELGENLSNETVNTVVSEGITVKLKLMELMYDVRNRLK